MVAFCKGESLWVLGEEAEDIAENKNGAKGSPVLLQLASVWLEHLHFYISRSVDKKFAI